jgi:hypothetical protein
MKGLMAAGAMVLLFVSVGLADTDVDYDHGVNFAKYHTYAWRTAPSHDNNDLVNNSLVLSRIHSAVNEKMSIRGLHQDPANPDLYVIAHLSAQTVQDIDYWPPAYGWGYWGYMGPDVIINRYVEGTMIIDIVDAKLNRLVWRAISTKTGDSLVDVQKEKKIDEMVTKAFKKFPPRVST